MDLPRQIVFFLVDTQGANCVGAYTGNAALRTPNVDRLASEGVRFDRAYTCSPVCGPARSAIFTGLFPHSNGVLGNDMAPHLDIPTLGQRLSKAGIPTAYIGKWHLDGTDYFGDGRCPAGWDPNWWFDGRNYLNSLPDQAARDLSRRVLGPEEVASHGITAEFTHAYRTADRARKFIDEHKNQDFFLVVSIDEPHHPFICPEPFVSGFENFLFPVANADDSLSGKPLMQREWAEHMAGLTSELLIKRDNASWLKCARFFSCNSYSDNEVGRVIEAINLHAPSCLVVYTSDHGDMLGGHRLGLSKGPAMYQEITRIPWIVRWPGQSPKGGISSALVSHIDLAPTFLEYFGVPVPDLLHGKSLIRQFKAPALEVNRRVFMEFNRYEVDHDGFGAFSPIRCVFDGRHKLAINLLDADELYDLEEDPAELRNRIEDPARTEIRNGLHDELLKWMGTTRDPLRAPHWGRRPWRTWRQSTWGGSTRPRPFDEGYYPRTLLYETGRVIDRYTYDKR